MPELDVHCRLAAYGSLAPGRSNHGKLLGLRGSWREGEIRGNFYWTGWGVTIGIPALILDPVGQIIPVHVFESLDLPSRWPALDSFEGSDYRRVVTNVSLAEGKTDAWIYVLADQTKIAGLRSLTAGDDFKIV